MRPVPDDDDARVERPVRVAITIALVVVPAALLAALEAPAWLVVGYAAAAIVVAAVTLARR